MIHILRTTDPTRVVRVTLGARTLVEVIPAAGLPPDWQARAGANVLPPAALGLAQAAAQSARLELVALAQVTQLHEAEIARAPEEVPHAVV